MSQISAVHMYMDVSHEHPTCCLTPMTGDSPLSAVINCQEPHAWDGAPNASSQYRLKFWVA